MISQLLFRLRLARVKKDSPSPIMRVSERTARKMPDLGLPHMPPKARAAFRDVLLHDRGSLKMMLEFAEARGFTAHPSDWVPSSRGGQKFPLFYQPWAEWLVQKGYSPFNEGVRLTAENWKRWSKDAREDALRHLLREDRPAAHGLFLTAVSAEPEAIRAGLFAGFTANDTYTGMHSADVGILYHFLKDPSPKVKALAKYKLAALDGLENEDVHVQKVTPFFKRIGPQDIALLPGLFDHAVERHLGYLTFDFLADALGFTAQDLAGQFDIDCFKGHFRILLLTTANADCKRIVARRLVAAGKTDFAKLFVGVERAVWEQGLRGTFSSVYPSTVFDFLGREAGTLTLPQIREIDRGWFFGKSVTRELETGELPVNTSYDPLRVLALLANKEAAQMVLQDALDLGIKPDNPRLTMLKYNLAL